MSDCGKGLNCGKWDAFDPSPYQNSETSPSQLAHSSTLKSENWTAPCLSPGGKQRIDIGLLIRSMERMACFAWLVDRANPWVASPATYESPALVLLALPAILHPIRLVQAGKERKGRLGEMK